MLKLEAGTDATLSLMRAQRRDNTMQRVIA